MSTGKRRQHDSFTEINITPLTDIFLVLLIIMMVIAPLLDQQGINLTVPTNQEVKQEKDNKIINVSVSSTGEYSIDGEKISADSLMQAIKVAYNEKKDGLLIQASENSTHESVVRVMDIAQTIGIASVSVIAD
jgi:biopolymer transport protein ExbD